MEDLKSASNLENTSYTKDTIESIFDKTIQIQEKIFEVWEEIFELEEQNVNIYEKLDESRDKIDKLSETVNELNEKLKLPYIEEESTMPTPREISYWTNFGHFPDKECKECKCKS